MPVSRSARAAISLAATLAWAPLACAPLADEGCPLPCPAACPASCFASGLCAEVSADLLASDGPLYSNQSPFPVALGALPANADVELTLSLLLDFPARAHAAAWDYQFILVDPAHVSGGVDQVLIDAQGFDASAFPVQASWQGPGRTDALGVLTRDLMVQTCRDRSGAAVTQCQLLAGSRATARVLDSGPWTLAPACGSKR